MRKLTLLLAMTALGTMPVPPAAAYDFIEFLEPLPLDFVQGGAAVAGAGDRLYWLDDKRSLLYVLTAAGKPVATTAASQLSYPMGLGIGPGGEVLVADTGNSRVCVFDRDGKLLRTLGEKGSAPGQLYKPRGVAVGLDGRIWVADTGNNRVQVFTSEGIFLFGFGVSGKEAGQFKGPGRIAVDAADNIFVLDEGNERVQKFDAGTKHVKDFSLHGQDFALDEFGFLYMMDPDRSKVKEMGPDGIVMGAFGTDGKAKGQFRKAGGIAVDEQGIVLIADAGNKRLQRARLQSKLKTDRVKMNLDTKLLVTGPTRFLSVAASALAVAGDELFAWLPKTRHIAVFKGAKEVRRFGGPDVKGEAAIRSAHGLVASPKWGLFISDGSPDRILSFGLDGQHKTNIGATEGWFASKKKEGRVKAPAGLALNERGTVYVADAGNRRVDGFGPDGSFLFTFGPVLGPHELSNPVDVAWDEAGFLYVLDSGLKKVIKCEPSGGFLKAWGEEGEGVAQFEDPVAIAYDGKSYLYVLDKGRKRVSVFDREGRWVTNFFSGGSGDRSLGEPTGMLVTGSELIIADPSRRVASFSLRPRLAPPAVSTRTLEGEVFLSWEAAVDPWTARYRVSRATQAAGPWVDAGVTAKPGFKDSAVEPYQTYLYKVAVEAVTGDVGPFSRPMETFVPGSFNTAPIEFSTVSVGNIFSANYKWYLKNPLGKAVVVNNVNVPFQNVKVSFRLKDFMDFATETVIEKLGPKEKVEVQLAATLNNKALEVSEDTPIQAEVTLTYFEKGKKQDVSLALPLRVYSRHAITWEDPRRVANFITPNDKPVDLLQAAITRDPVVGSAAMLNDAVVKGVRVWTALSAGGIRFLASGNNPFEQVSQNPAFPVDYTQFPRDTLERKSGECDDLVTLFSSLMEKAAVRTAILDYPGHLAFMFNTGAADALEAGLPADMLVSYNGTMWVPVETTMIGQPFGEAVRKAAFAFREMDGQKKANVIEPGDAWKVYEPATIDTPAGPPLAFDKDDAAKAFEASAADLLLARYKALASELDAREKADGPSASIWNQRGLIEIQYGKSAEAEKAFEKAVELDAVNAAALNNLGNCDYEAGRIKEASERYQKAAAADPEDAGILMNLARAAIKLGNGEEAKAYAEKAVALDSGFKEVKEELLKL